MGWLKLDPAEEDSDQSGDPPKLSHGQISLLWFFAILTLNVFSLLWLSVRASSPSYIAVVLDFFLHSTIGGIIIFFAFKAMLRYPYRLTDLFTITLVLSLGLKTTVRELYQLTIIGIASPDLFAPRGAGHLVQACLLTASVLIAGAAMGLRNCKLLNKTGTLTRALTVASGMVALPAAAGVPSFPILILRDIVLPESGSKQTHILALLWFGSLIASGINAADLLRTTSLKSVIDAREKMP